MSKKTNFKRIALVAVASLGLGVLTSVAPANAAVAAGEITVSAQTALVNANACSISTTAGKIGGTFVNGSTVQLTGGLTAGDSVYIVLAGPATVVSASGASATTTSTTFTDAATGVGETYTIRLTGEGAVTATVSSTSSTAAVDVLTFASVASCLASDLSIADSNFTITSDVQTDNDDAAGTAWVTAYNGVDTSKKNIVAISSTGYMRALLTNAYGATLSSKPIVVTGTGNGSGCLVAVEATDATAGVGTAPAAATAVMTGTGADITLAVKAAKAGEAVSCSVVLTWNGKTVGTKAFTLQGVPAKVVVSGVTVGVRSGAGYYRAAVTDALGNALPSITISSSSTETNNAASALVVSNAAAVAAVTGTATDAATGAVTGTTPAVTSTNLAAVTVGSYTCTSKGGAAKLTVRALASGVTYVTSAPFDVYCGAASIDTWAISLDKASYQPGEIATLTVSAKDADGFVAQSLLAIGASAYSFGGMTFVTAPTDTDKFSSAAGVKTYQLSVGTTEGSFVGTFKLTGTTDTSAKTISYKIASGTATVSNADVLKSIVALIASINKQIQALQKLILKR